jgi:hypothetical protein
MTEYLYAVELDVSKEARVQGFRVPKGGRWVIHDESEDGIPGLCVYEDKDEAREALLDREHPARLATFKRVKGRQR